MIASVDQLVYILVEEANFPFCLPPRPGEDLVLVVYTDKTDAKSAFHKFTNGDNYPLPRDPLKVLELSYSSVMDLVPELEVFAEEEFASKFSIQLEVRLNGVNVVLPKFRPVVSKQQLN